MNKYFAECLGTCTLTLAVLLSLSSHLPIPTPFIAALTLGLFVYTIGPISGTHINPAITIALLTIKKISVLEALKYILVQFIGAGLALLISHALVTPIAAGGSNSLSVGLAELLGTFFLGFGVASVVYGKVPEKLSGIIIGGSLLLGILIAASASNGVLNPAVAIGIGSFSIMYAFAPVLGAILGMYCFRFLIGEKLFPQKTV